METIPSISCLRQLLDVDISRMKSAELQLKNTIISWVSNENSMPLRLLMNDYLDVVEKHIRLLEIFCKEEKISAYDLSNGVMKTYIAEAAEKLACCSCPEIKDACLLAAVQQINHYKISVYGTAAAFAGALRLQKAGLLFHQAELDEKDMDERLSYLAEHELNKKAIAPFALAS
ncbi:ferritin-like domain-containing protein [Mucilaginibacter sp. AW1-7]|jgi:ferritin-like metal-binding protein YciE|uniref:YciE/YciF ferroxidase family protein n=1 Tax=Mucilaginibacter sp. AW1-7 TaxID=3349874 RepID=UPI003F73212D